MKYTKQGNDQKYRVINIGDINTRDFQNFLTDSVDYPEGCVLEVQRVDGTRHIEYGRHRICVQVSSFGNCLYLPESVPLARLWIRSTEGIGMCYKVPLRTQVHDKNSYILIPGGTHKVELIGDPYFDAVYELKRV